MIRKTSTESGARTVFTVHRLTAADVPMAIDLLAVFGDAFAEPETYGVPPDAGYLARVLGKDHVVVLAALRDGAGDERKMAGGLLAYVLDKPEQARSEVYIYDLAVAAAHRRQGIATALIEELRRIAATSGAWSIFVQADYGDDAAVALYTKLGIREDVMHFDIPVGRIRASTG